MTMSGQWEVVGKPKKTKVNGQSNKLTKTEKKKFVENAPKAEDFLPAMEVKTLYTTLGSKKSSEKGKENSPKQASVNKNTKEVESARKAVKKVAPQAPQPEKKKGPRGMEECLKALDLAELTSLVEGGRAQFPNDPSVWLRPLAATINSKLPTNPWSDNPSLTHSLLVLCPAKLSKFLLGIARDIGNARQAFFENCISAIANDMSKGVAANGWLLLTEVLAQVAPELAVSNIARWNSLMKSYQNRQLIGSAILWGLGQAGLRSLQHGIQVWESVFLPAAELKSYTRMVVDSLAQMLIASTKRGNAKENRVIPENYASSLKRISSLVNYGAVSKEVANLYAVFQELAVLSVDKSTMFVALLGTFNGIPTSHPLRSQMLQSLSQSLQSDLKTVSATWKDAYRSTLVSSAALLKYINSQWSNYKTGLSNLKFKEFLLELKTKSLEISGVKGADKEGLMECQRLIEDLLTKLTKMSGGFPWKTANLLLIIAISGLAAYDINKHGSFKSSSTGIFLENTGVLHYGQIAVDTSRQYYQVAYKWGEKELPPMWVKYGSPAWEVVKDTSFKGANLVKVWAINVSDWAKETWPVVAESVERYAPGLLGKCQEVGSTAWGYTKQYSELGYGHAKNASLSAYTWVNTNVLVGRLSPENLSKVSLEAINATQTFAIDTYQWIYQKVLPPTTTSSKNV